MKTEILVWVCADCGAREDVVNDDPNPEGHYIAGDCEPCIDCGEGTCHVVEEEREVSHPPVWRAFTADDWQGLAGAECFAGNVEPLLAELEVNGLPSLAILDGLGLCIMIDAATEDAELGGSMEVRFDYPLAARAALLLRGVMTLADLQALPGVRP